MTDINDSAEDTVIGFDYQGYFALVTLMDVRGDDLAAISVETRDDLELDGKTPTLCQLKHRKKNTKRVSIKSPDFWKTIRIWTRYHREEDLRFQLILTVALTRDSGLDELATSARVLPQSVIEGLVRDMCAEAARVLRARESSIVKKQAPAFADVHVEGCSLFLALSGAEKKSFVSRIRIVPSQFTANDIFSEVEKRLTIFPKRYRAELGSRLIAWWDHEVARSLLGIRSRRIRMDELLEKISNISSMLDEDILIDDYSFAPLPQDLGDCSNIRRQLELIDAPDYWFPLATEVRWRAMSQRDKWIRESFSRIERLKLFDDRLIKEWSYQHQKYCHKYNNKGMSGQKAGRKVLNWSFEKAPNTITPIDPHWTESYLTRGTFQQKAEEKVLGWHPNFKELLTDEG